MDTFSIDSSHKFSIDIDQPYFQVYLVKSTNEEFCVRVRVGVCKRKG